MSCSWCMLLEVNTFCTGPGRPYGDRTMSLETLLNKIINISSSSLCTVLNVYSSIEDVISMFNR